MTTKYFKVTLLSDIILNQKAATEGPNKTLDFIPGSNFLGIAAKELYDSLRPEEALYIFHSGAVRFGDAHLAYRGSRCHKVPAAMFYPKLKKASEELYISHHTDMKALDIRAKQLKQCRVGFYDFTTVEAVSVKAETTFAIKSAHDVNKRTSKDEKMYGYESLCSGSAMYFSVELDDDKYAETIVKALVGSHHIGRSRSAQYGLVEIEEVKSYNEVKSGQSQGNEVAVYADSRLIFIEDETGLPTYRPTTEQIGIENGDIDWERSQIRTFQYAPWNGKRKCFDTDRCGIEKGSVIVVKNVSKCPSESRYVGSYRCEGFGRVIYNPSFLEADTTGKAYTRLCEKTEQGHDKNAAREYDLSSPLLQCLLNKRWENNLENEIMELVNNWVEANEHSFDKSKLFASQWGTIRSIAGSPSSTPLIDQLFADKVGYLTHGVAKEKWEERGRTKKLEIFLKDRKLGSDDATRRLALVNLAAEMAKRCRKEDEK
ncbi:MAG: hypothetical protein KBS75_06485 [Bacteroidales bacterium]|nr:hypothetical protein [Candidatus Equimonas faecalis]